MAPEREESYALQGEHVVPLPPLTVSDILHNSGLC